MGEAASREEQGSRRGGGGGTKPPPPPLRRSDAALAGCAVVLLCICPIVFGVLIATKLYPRVIFSKSIAVASDAVSQAYWDVLPAYQVRPRCLLSDNLTGSHYPGEGEITPVEPIDSARTANSTVVFVQVGPKRQQLWFGNGTREYPEEQMVYSPGLTPLLGCPLVKRVVLGWWASEDPPVGFGVYGEASPVPIQVSDQRGVGLGERVMASRLERSNASLDGENVMLFDDDKSMDCETLASLVAAVDRWPDRMVAPIDQCRQIAVDGLRLNYKSKTKWFNVAITPALLLKTELLRRVEAAMSPEQVEWSSRNLQGEDVMLNWAVSKTSRDGRTAVCLSGAAARKLPKVPDGIGLSDSVLRSFSGKGRHKKYMRFRASVSEHVAREMPLGPSPGDLCTPLPALLARVLLRQGRAGAELAIAQSDVANASAENKEVEPGAA